MLTGKIISITAKTVIENTEIATHGAVINLEENDISFYMSQLDKPMCKLHREALRADQAEFEDFAYKLQEHIPHED